MFEAAVVVGFISTPSADAKARFRSRRAHSSSHANGVREVPLVACGTGPFDAAAALQRRD
ncbi:hypothetical protein GB937_006509 [Aspergillus fischeri]|nr:hypothetical protein GB937_006509 [Aspergillus fischeri]